MNALRANQLLIIGILLTLMALTAHPYLPKKKLDLLNNPQFSNFIYYTQGNEANDIALWVDEPKHIWSCNVSTAAEKNNIYPTCSFNVWLAHEKNNQGIDLSDYKYLLVDLNYQGVNTFVRIYIRNYNSNYSTIEDTNSTKSQSTRIGNLDLDKPVLVKLDEFEVADWWLRQYKIKRADAGRDISNVISVGIDYEDILKPGNYTIEVNQLIVIGEWIDQENWYLLILCPWLFGILVYAIVQIRVLRQQNRFDRQQISQLSQQNSSLKQQSDEFRRLSTVDPLTQCFNRFGIHQIVASLLEQRNSDAYFSLILLDIDYFKRINDRRGHDVGDRVLQVIGKIIHDRIRTQDFAGRWGGEEFIIVLPGTPKSLALAMAEKLRILIFDEIFEAEQPLNITASFGVCEYRRGEDFASSFKRVDEALYKAKDQGRNCVVLAEE